MNLKLKRKIKKILIIDDDVNFQKILDLTVKDRDIYCTPILLNKQSRYWGKSGYRYNIFRWLSQQ